MTYLMRGLYPERNSKFKSKKTNNLVKNKKKKKMGRRPKYTLCQKGRMDGEYAHGKIFSVISHAGNVN